MASDVELRDENGRKRDRVAYLIGAGASHACVKWVKSPYGILMGDLGLPLSERVSHLIRCDYGGKSGLMDLANAVIDEDTDFEHVISFLDDSPSMLHRKFAADLRSAFEDVLRSRLKDIRDDNDDEDPVELYAALLDMHNIKRCPEELAGMLTINYDEYIERAIEKTDLGPVDFGFEFGEVDEDSKRGVKLLKLHGSLGWQDTWPTSRGGGDATLWIPPGIHKAKQRYPFNILWGLARELLRCDVLRIIGCKLDGNDWDLISLLFTTCHVSYLHRPYRVEVIDAPKRAEDMKTRIPYLEVVSILEIEEIGPQIVAEFSAGPPRPFDQLRKHERKEIIEVAGDQRNWFEIWLRAKAESLDSRPDGIRTPGGWFQRFLDQAYYG